MSTIRHLLYLLFFGAAMVDTTFAENIDIITHNEHMNANHSHCCYHVCSDDTSSDAFLCIKKIAAIPYALTPKIVAQYFPEKESNEGILFGSVAVAASLYGIYTLTKKLIYQIRSAQDTENQL